MGSNGGQVEKGQPGRKKEARKKKAEKGPKKFSRFMRHFPTTDDTTANWDTAYTLHTTSSHS